MNKNLVFYNMSFLKMWGPDAPRHEKTPGYLIYEWLDGRPSRPLFARIMRIFDFIYGGQYDH